MRFLLMFVPMILVGKGILVSPPSPTAAAGGTVTISADRPVAFSLTGVGALANTTATSTTYTAPAALNQTHVMAGCMVLPADSVYNTRIDTLPIAANSATWVANLLLSNGLGTSEQWGINVIDDGTPLAPQAFHYTPGFDGELFPAIPAGQRKREGGTYTVDGNNDHHLVAVNHDSCTFYETYQDGVPVPGCPTCTAASGWTYNSITYEQPNTVYGGGTTDAAGLPLAPLTVHLDEIKAGAIKHALRFTSCAGCISNQAIWPAIGSTGANATAAPMGTRLRLTSWFDITPYPPAAQVVLRALRQYGMFLSDIGTAGQITFSSDVTRDTEVMKELGWLNGVCPQCFEVVDESSLMLSSALNTANPNNPYVQPTNSAILTITDAATPANVVTVPIALQPVTVGTPEPALAVQAGSEPFQIRSWVHGASDSRINWSISPQIGAGTIAPDGTYTAPTDVTEVTRATITLTAVADPNAMAAIALTIFPAGEIYIDTANANNTIDANGQTWLADFGFETGSYSDQDDSYWWRTLGPQTSYQTQYYTYRYTWGDDIVYSLHVPNGTYKVTFLFGLGGVFGTYNTGVFDNGLINGPMNLDAQGETVAHNWNIGPIVNYGARTPASVDIPANVTDTSLMLAIRAITNGLGHSAPFINAIRITRDTDPAHIAIDNQGITIVGPGAQLQLYPVDWFSGSHTFTWRVMTGPGTITPDGIYTAPAANSIGQWVTIRLRDTYTGLSAISALYVPASGQIPTVPGTGSVY